MKKYTAIIIGAGSIGALKPDHIDKKSGRCPPLTHAHACFAHPRIDLVHIVDSDIQKASDASEKWDCGFCGEIVSGADIMIVATPTETHLDVVTECLKYNPKLIICEKPVGEHLGRCIDLVGSCQIAKVPLMVDYSRRFEPLHQGVALKLQDPSVEIYNARVIYARGLKHDGCHAIDLCNWWFGKPFGWHTGNTNFIKSFGCYPGNIADTNDSHQMFGGEYYIDRDKNDPTLNGVMSYERCPFVVFTGVDGRKSYTFEIDVMTSIGRFQFYHYGLWFNHWPIMTKGQYGDYAQLGLPKKQFVLDMKWNLRSLLNNAVNYLDGNEDLKCTGDDALAVHKILEG